MLQFVLNIAVFEGQCITSAVPGQQVFECVFSNPVASVVCSFDGGDVENCSFPLEVGIVRFGTDNHTVVVTVVDVFGQSLNLTFNFNLIPRKSFAFNEAKVTHFQYYSSTYTRLSNICCSW